MILPLIVFFDHRCQSVSNSTQNCRQRLIIHWQIRTREHAMTEFISKLYAWKKITAMCILSEFSWKSAVFFKMTRYYESPSNFLSSCIFRFIFIPEIFGKKLRETTTSWSPHFHRLDFVRSSRLIFRLTHHHKELFMKKRWYILKAREILYHPAHLSFVCQMLIEGKIGVY